MTDQDLMPFGKHKGEKLANVPAKYLLWLHEVGTFNEGLNQYINDNLDVLKQEANEK